MTLKELAKLANVSQSTVSKAFSNASDISAETREHIFRVAKEHHCYEKFHKGNYFKKIVAIICPEIKSEAYHRIVTHLETLLTEMGISVVLSISNFSSDTEEALFYYHAHYQKVDGILIVGSSNTYNDESTIPTVHIKATSPRDSNVISANRQNAINDAVKYLTDMGHCKIAFIGDPMTDSKKASFLRAMQRWLLPIQNEYIITSANRFEKGGYEGMEKLIALPKPPTAIITAYDYMAFGALKCIRDHGLSVPDDFSLIGQDNVELSSYSEPSLTSISYSCKEQCELAVQLLQKKMRNAVGTNTSIESPPSTLVIRDSVKKIN